LLYIIEGEKVIRIIIFYIFHPAKTRKTDDPAEKQSSQKTKEVNS